MKPMVMPQLFTEQNYRRLIAYLNTMFQSLTFGDNLSGQIVKDITIPAGTRLRIDHNLKVVPAYWIILRQRGNGQVTEPTTDGEWTDKYIELTNHAAAETTITVLIMRG